MSKIIPQEKLYSAHSAKIGVLGGTFDPPHFAHIHMAQAAKKELGLDFVVFMPLGEPPHGKNGISEARHRIAMLEIILSDYEDFYIDISEAYLDGVSYTVNSIERINKLLGEDSVFYFIIGADSLMYLEKWYDARKLMQITEFAVIPRAGYEKEECLAHVKMLKKQFGASIVYIDTEELDHSSSQIRKNPFAEDLDDTAEEIYNYIKENGLYNK